MDFDLTFEQVNKFHPSPDKPVRVFEGLNLTIPQGQHVALIGRSGTGKSTLLRLANRLEDPDAGKILFGGKPLNTLTVTDHRRQVALVTQKPCLYARSALENVMFPDTLRNKEPDEIRAKELFETVEMGSEYFSRGGDALSVGQQQRICLARALYCRPKVLMLDETTSSMDPNLAVCVMENLVKLNKEQKMTIIHVTHDMDKLKMADRVVLLAEGQVAEDTPPAQFLNNPATDAGRRFLGK